MHLGGLTRPPRYALRGGLSTSMWLYARRHDGVATHFDSLPSNSSISVRHSRIKNDALGQYRRFRHVFFDYEEGILGCRKARELAASYDRSATLVTTEKYC